jgi:hypothetical protein
MIQKIYQNMIFSFFADKKTATRKKSGWQHFRLSNRFFNESYCVGLSRFPFLRNAGASEKSFFRVFRHADVSVQRPKQAIWPACLPYFLRFLIENFIF